MTDRKLQAAYATPDVYHENGSIQYGQNGVTVHEYFAAAAMQGMLSSIGIKEIYDIANNRHSDRIYTITKAANKMADSMILARYQDAKSN